MGALGADPSAPPGSAAAGSGRIVEKLPGSLRHLGGTGAEVGHIAGGRCCGAVPDVAGDVVERDAGLEQVGHRGAPAGVRPDPGRVDFSPVAGACES